MHGTTNADTHKNQVGTLITVSLIPRDCIIKDAKTIDKISYLDEASNIVKIIEAMYIKYILEQLSKEW